MSKNITDGILLNAGFMDASDNTFKLRWGNCFRTSDVAEAMAEKIKKLLKGE